MSNTVYKSDQIYSLSKKLGLTNTEVKKVLDLYFESLLRDLNSGNTVKFLNVCYLVCGKDKGSYHETLAYKCTEISKELKMGKNIVYGILSTFEDLLVLDLRRFYSYSIRGLVHISLEEYREGIYKVRIRKSSSMFNEDIRVVSINSFKRKVEGFDR